MKTIARKININQIKIFWLLSIGIVTLVVVYVYFVNVITFNTAKMSHLEESIADFKSNISEMEFSLIEKNKEVTRDFAYTNGFVDITETTFVYTGDNSLTLNEPKP